MCVSLRSNKCIQSISYHMKCFFFLYIKSSILSISFMAYSLHTQGLMCVCVCVVRGWHFPTSIGQQRWRSHRAEKLLYLADRGIVKIGQHDRRMTRLTCGHCYSTGTRNPFLLTKEESFKKHHGQAMTNMKHVKQKTHLNQTESIVIKKTWPVEWSYNLWTNPRRSQIYLDNKTKSNSKL